MASSTPTSTRTTARTAQRIVLAGGFAVAVVVAPLTAILSASQTAGPAVASCPIGEEFNAATGACKPLTDTAPATFNPINPENNPLQTGEITSSRAGNVGQLPEIAGIPCTGTHGGGGSTGECIGLQEEQNLAPTLKPPVPQP